MWFDRPRPASSLTPPPTGNILNFIDESGTPSIMNDQGDVTPSATLLGGPVPLAEQSGDPATAPNVIAIYNKLGDGLVQRAPNNGLVRALGGDPQTIDWSGGVPGAYYGAGDIVITEHNSIVQFSLVDGAGVIQFTLPPITVASAGQRVSFRNVIDKKGGSIPPDGLNLLINVDAANRTLTFGLGVQVGIASGSGFNEVSLNFEFESDGLNTWLPVLFGGVWDDSANL